MQKSQENLKNSLNQSRFSYTQLKNVLNTEMAAGDQKIQQHWKTNIK